jgi:uncharacterized protein YjbJ (UPF0337 family)
MDKDRIDGAGKKVTGSVKEAIGKVTGDAKLQAEGTADKGREGHRARRGEEVRDSFGAAPPKSGGFRPRSGGRRR